ncbi:MAG: hypothetical protein HOA16_11705 [Opitutae bacterium]|nr:hypothetical protein [Opitutae bacterium]
MKSKPFTLTKYKRPGRPNRWRVRGTLHGKQIEKTFPDLGMANVWKDVKEIARTNSKRQAKATLTRLSPEEAFDAEKALGILDGKTTLTQLAESFQASYVGPEDNLSIGDAQKRYDEEREKAHLRGLLSRPMHRSSRAVIARFVSWHGSEKDFASVTYSNFQGFLDDNFTGPKNYENQRGYLSHFFKWGLSKRHLNADPTIGTTSLAKQNAKARGVAATLSPDQVKELFAWLEANRPEMVPSFALMTFAGIRPCKQYGEITRLTPDLVNVDQGIITVLPTTSKVKELRKFKMSPNLLAWLRAYPLDRFPITCKTRKSFKKWRGEIGAKFKLGHDVLRHSAITYWVRKNKSIFDAAEQFGNSESVIRKHYKDNNRTDDEAESFFEIFPRAEYGQLLKFSG